MHCSVDGRCCNRELDNLVACIKAVLWQQSYIVALTPDPANRGTINLGKRVGGRAGDNPHVHTSW